MKKPQRRRRRQGRRDYSRHRVSRIEQLEDRRMLSITGTPADYGDFDFDGHVGARDFLAWQRSPSPRGNIEIWRQNFGDIVLRPDDTLTKHMAHGDFDGNGIVGSRDFLAWQRGGGVNGQTGLENWRTRFGSVVHVRDDSGASTFSVDLLDRKLFEGNVHLSGAGADDTLVLQNVGFATSVVLSLSGPDRGMLTIATPAGASNISYSDLGTLDLGGAVIDVSCVSGLNEEFVVSTSDSGINVLVNGVASPQLLNVGQIHLHADQGDADSAALIAPPSDLMRIHVDAAHGMTSATTSAADVNLHHFADVRLGEELQVNQATLEIVGTHGADEWRLTTNSIGDLIASSSGRVATLSGIEAVKFQGGMGDDCLELALAPVVSLSGGVTYEGGGGLNDLIVTGAPITNLRLSDNGQAGTLRAGGTEIAFAGLTQNWAASSMAAQSPSYILDETAGISQVTVPVQVSSQNTIREVSFAIDTVLVGSDRAEFFIVDAANHANVLIGGPGGAPLLTLSQTGAVYDTTRVNYANSQLHVDISSISSSANAQLLVRIVDQDNEAASLVRVQPLSNDLTTGLLTMELPGSAGAFHGFTIDGTWLSGSGDFLEVGLIVLDEEGTVDGLSPQDIGFAQVVSSSDSRRILFNGEQGIGANTQVVMPIAGSVAVYVSHNNLAATIPSEHIQILPTGGGSWNVGWEKSQSVFGSIGRRNYDDAVFQLTAAEACSPLLVAGEGDQSGGSIGEGGGSAISDGCVVTLVEGDSFDVDWTSPITIPASGSLTFSFSNLDFDTTDEGFVNDAFEVALVDSNGNSLIRTIEPRRDAFFNITEGQGVASAQGVIVDGNTVTIGLGGLIPGDQARMIFRLVNNDDDFTTTVQISTLELIADEIAAVAPGGVGVAESVQPVGSLGENATTAGVVTVPTDDVLSGILPGNQAEEDLPPVHPDDTPLDSNGSVVFDSPQDFARGMLFNLQQSSAGIQLVPAGETEFLPLIWVSNSGEGTVSKFDTRTGKELGRYRTSGGGGDPSRVAVTRDGDAWVANRAGAGTVIKVLHEGFIDRNGNGVIDTSQDLNNDGTISGAEILPWDANSDGLPDDERIQFVVTIGAGPRGVAIDANNKVWISPYNSTGFRVFDNATGQLETIVAAPHGSYGAVIDGDGNLWSATSGGGSTIMRIDTVNRVFVETVQVASAYGITVDQDGIVWTSPWSGNTLSRYDPSTRELTTYPIPASSGGGITVDRQGNVWFGTANSNRVWKFTFAEDRKTLLNSESVVVGQNPKSASIDADGYLWTVALSSNNAWKIDTVTNTVVAGPIPTGASPYNYSDMTGGVFSTVTQRSGTWKQIVDAGRLDAVWTSLGVASTAPDPSVVRSRVRTSNIREALTTSAWIDVPTSGSLLGLSGRYLEIEATLESTDSSIDPSIESITVNSVPPPEVTILTPTDGAVLEGSTTLLSGLAVAGQATDADPQAPLNEIIAVTVDGVAVELLDAGGHFFSRVTLQPGINRFEVQATDVFGQATTSTVAVFAGPAPSEVDFSKFADITGSFTGVYGRTSLNEEDARLYLNLAIRNDGIFDADAPLLIGVTNISDPSVSVLNPDGYTPAGIPYFNYTSVTTNGTLGPNELTLFPTVGFDVPHRERFDYDLVFFGKLNQPPAITTLPDIEALAGRPYVYDVDAIDPDQDVVAFSLLAAPAGMTIDPTTGVVQWSPQTADIGNYEIVVRADDGRGGAAQQRYTLTVIAPPPNRPPIIVSTPVTMAKVGEQVDNSPTDFDLSGWSVVQYNLNSQGPANWVLESNNTVARQTRNADASILLSDIVLENSRIDGTWQVATGGDDDLMGFVFGYQDEQNYYLFDWKQSTQGDSLGTAQVGMSVKRISADSELTGRDLWPTSGNTGRVTTLFHNDTPWLDNVEYQFTLETRPGHFTIVVRQDENVLATIPIVDETYPSGKFGFYNYSQDNVLYSGFTLQSVAELTYQYDGNAIDPDGDSLTYSLIDKPEGMVINEQTGIISWGPTYAQIGENDVLVRVEDGRGGVAEQAYVVAVKGDPANNPPIFVSTPITKFQSLGASNLSQGLVTPGEIDIRTFGATTVSEIVSLTIPDDGGGEGSADIVFVVDESGSMAGEHAWLTQLITTINASLEAEGVIDNRFGLVGFADSARVRQAGPDRFMSAPDFATAAATLSLNQGGNEDGYRGIDYALDNYAFRTDAAKAIILVTDEHRTTTDSSLNFQNITTALENAGVYFSLVGNANLADANAVPAIGVAGDGNSYINDGSGTLVVSSGGVYINSDPVDGGTIANIKTQYVDLAWGLDGVTWNLNILRDGGQAAQFFSQVFVDVLAEDIVRQLPIDVVASDPNVGFVNLTGILSDVGPGETASFNIQFDGSTPAKFDLTFVRPDTGAILGSIPVTVNGNYYYNSLALDADGDTLTYSIVDGPDGLMIDVSTGELSWEVSDDDIDTHPVTIRVVDGRGGTDEQTFEIEVVGGGTGAIRGSVVVDEVGSGADPADGPVLLLTPNGLGNTVGPAIAAAGFEIIVARQEPNAIASQLAVRPDIDQIWIWNDRSDRGGGSSEVPVNPDLAFTSADLEALAAFSATHDEWIMDGLSWRTHATESERNLTANEAIALATTGGGIVLGADNGPATGVTNSITQHVNQVAAHFGFELFIGAYSTPASIQFEGGRLFDQPNPVDPSQLTSSTTSYAELPHGLQANGIYLETAVFGSPSSSFGGPSSPPLQPDTFSGQTYASVNHILTSSIAGVGFDREGIPNWVVYIDQNENGVRDPGERFTITDADGNYEFTGLAAGEYVVREEPQIGWRQTAPAGDRHELTLANGGVLVDIDFGNVQVDVGNNTQPRFTSTPLTAATALSAYLYDANAVDDQGDLLEFTLAAGPAGMTINPQTGVVGWLPTLNQLGTHDVLLRVTDSGGLSSVQSFAIEVLPFNTAPVFTSSPPTTGVVGSPLAYQAIAQDAQGDTLTFIKTAGPSSLSVNSSTGLVEWTPGAAGPVDVTIRVTDGRGGEATQTFTLNVATTAPNTVPSITSTPRTTTRLGRTYIYLVNAADPDSDPLTYSLTTAPAGMTIDENTGAIMWLPAPGDVALPHPVVFSVIDGRGGTATQSFDLQVIHTDINSPPLIVSAAKTAARTDILYSYDAAALDADDGELLWSLATAPIGMSIDVMSGSIRWIPTLEQAGEHEVVLRVTDAVGAESTQTFTILVDCVNGTPLITSVPLTRAVAGGDYYYGVRATDPNGDALDFRFGNATPANIGMTIDSGGLIRWTPSAAHVGSHEIVIVVEDSYGAFATQRYTVFVEPEFDGQGESNRNRPPRITSTPTFAAEVDAAYSYQVVAEDLDGDVLVYEFGNPADIPAGLELDEDTGLLTWTPTIDHVGDFFVAIVVRDPQGAVASQAFSIAVRDNLAPEITSEPVDEAFAGATYRYDVRAVDPEGDPLTFTLDARPDGMTIDQLGRIHWIVPSGATAAPVTITVADDRGQTDTQSFTIDVQQDTTAPRVFIFAQAGALGIPDGGRVDIGSTVVLTVNATDNVGVETLTLSINGTAVGLDANGQATVQAQLIGNLTALASATDAEGNTGQAQLVIQVVDPAAPNTPVPTDPNLPPHPGFDPTDNQGPTVIITSPEFGDSVTDRTPIVGTIDDPEDNLWYWRVYVGRADRVSMTAIDLNDPDYSIIAEGINEIHAAEIATLDPTLLTNDPYAILVAAFDVNGRGYLQPTLVNIEGAAKIGEFHLEFTDLSIPLAGLPIQVTRVYDSREAPTVGDFGHGWSLGVQDARILEIAAIGEGGAFNPGNDTFIPGKTKVYLTNPAGQRVGFTYQEQLTSASFFGGVWRPHFVADPGVYDTLTIDETQVARGGIIGALAQGINPDNYTLTTKDGIKYRYNQTTGLEKITDRSGNSIRFTEVGIFHDSSGVSIDFIRDSRGRITQIIDPDGGVIRYEYNLAGDLVRVTNQAAIDSTYTYLDSPAHFLDEGFDDRGMRDFKVTYDDQNRFFAILDAMGNVIQQQNYDELENNRAVIRDANNNETHLLYDERGNVLEETDAAGHTTYREYNDPLNPDLETRIVDRDGNVTERAYDSRGNVTRIVELGPLGNPLGTAIVTEFTYNSGNEVTSITNASGATTTFTYDTRGNLTGITNDEGDSSGFTYDGQGRRSTFTDFNGNTTQFVYSAPDCGCANPREIINEDGSRQTFDYNQFGQVTRESYLEADGTIVEETFRVYDASGRLSEERDGVGNIRRLFYDGDLLDWEVVVNPMSLDGMGRLTESPSTPVAQRRSRITDYEYDANDRLIRQTDAQGGVVEFRYDAQGNRILLQDPVGNITTWIYDELNRVVEERDPFYNEGFTIEQALNALAVPSGGSTATNTPAAHVTLFAYDGEGNLVEEIDRNGRRREMDYDHAGRMIEEQWFAAGTNALVETITFTYDTLGNLLTAHDSNSRYTYTYDVLNRVTSVDNFDGDPATPDVVLYYEYDAQGNVTKTYDGDGVTVESEYDQLNRLKVRKWYDADVPIGEDADVADARIDFAYNAAGRQTSVDRYSDLLAQNRVGSTITSYDLAGRTDVLRHQNAVDALLSQYDYGYDFGGLVTTEVRDHASNQYDQNILYGYDLTGQLVDAAFSGQADETFLYDANGNRIRSTNGGVVTNYTTGAANQLTSDGTHTYEYDGEGNQIKRRNIATGETTTYQYDHRNRLVQVDDWSSDPGDPEGPVAGAILTQSVEYTYDAMGRRIARSVDADGAGSGAIETEHYLYNGENVWTDFAETGEVSARYLFSNDIDRILARFRRSEDTSWYLTDRLGTVRELVNATGLLVNHTEYRTFGHVYTQLSSQLGDRFAFTGRELDAGSRDYFYRARFYNPVTGRFNSIDPLGFAAFDTNLYRYVINSALNSTDPSGTIALEAGFAIAVIGIGYIACDYFPACDAAVSGWWGEFKSFVRRYQLELGLGVVVIAAIATPIPLFAKVAIIAGSAAIYYYRDDIDSSRIESYLRNLEYELRKNGLLRY